MTTVVLAAGRSQRFGPANKLLAPVHGVPLIVLTLRRVLAATRGPVLVVTGHQAHVVRRAIGRHGLRSHRLKLVYHRRARYGMAGSLACGLTAAPRLSSAIQIHLADMPGIDPRVVSRLRQGLNRGAVASRPVDDGRPGHPVRLRRHCLPDSAQIAEHGLRITLRRLPDEVWHCVAAGARCIDDIDGRQMRRSLIFKPWARSSR